MSTGTADETPFLSFDEICREYGLAPRLVRRWIDAKRLLPVERNVGPDSQTLYSREQLLELLKFSPYGRD